MSKANLYAKDELTETKKEFKKRMLFSSNFITGTLKYNIAQGSVLHVL